MMMNKTIALAVLAIFAEQATAFNAHRHLHDAQKRGVEVEWTTVWKTVHVTAGVQPSAQAVPEEDKAVVAAAAEPTTTSTTVVVAPTQEAASVAAVQPTTLATSVKASAKASSTSTKVGVIESVVDAILKPSTTTTAETSKSTDSSDDSSDGSSSTLVFGSKKRGLAYNDAVLANLLGADCASCGWGYSWGSDGTGLDDAFNFVPMLWGDKATFTDSWDSNAEKALSNGAKALFSFNEPDHAEQANMSPEAAATAHAKYFSKYQGKAKIGAPAVTNSGDAGMGLSWLESFVTACKATDGCDYDFCNVHWYSQAEYADTLFEHLEGAHKLCDGKPVWLTEFAPIGGDDSSIADFLTTNLPKLDALEYLEAYSYFMASSTSLLSSLTSLSTFGKVYASLTS